MPDNTGTSNEKFRDTLKQFQLINRIITALSSTTDVQDIYSIILCALVSKRGLGFARSILFTYDPRFDTFTGNSALGPTTPEEARAFTSEMEKEEQALSEVLKNHSVSPQTDKTDAWDYCESGLRVSTLWISMAQKVGEQNLLGTAVKQLSYSCRPNIPGENFLHLACESRGPKIFDISEQPDIPLGLRKVLDTRFITIPRCSKSRKYAGVLVDRRFSPQPITADDLRHLEWFANQASLAVENALLYNDLQGAYQDLKGLDTLKSSFLSTVSHELRTPLTSILGFVELLLAGKAGKIPTNQQNLLSRMAKSTIHLIDRVNDIIEVAEIQAEGITDVQVEPVNPLPILMSAIKRIEERKGCKTVSIEPELRKDTPPILSEGHSLERIFYHILDNAVKFSRIPGRVTIKCGSDTGGRELRVAIADEGIGIPPAHLRRIFEEFYQVDNNLNRSYNGLGLGLTITRLLLKATGGKILAESTPGKGSVFTIVYPIAEGAPSVGG